MLIISGKKFFFDFCPPPPTFQMVHPLSFVEDFIIAMQSLWTLLHFIYLDVLHDGTPINFARLEIF